MLRKSGCRVRFVTVLAARGTALRLEVAMLRGARHQGSALRWRVPGIAVGWDQTSFDHAQILLVEHQADVAQRVVLV